MNKNKYGYKLSRSRGARKALFRSLIKSLSEYGSINTTNTKVKAVQGDIDKLINLAKKGDLASRRKIYAYLGNDRKTTDLIITKITPSLSKRTSGYTKIENLGIRRGDAAKMVRFYWSDEMIEDKKKNAKKPKKKLKAKTAKVTKTTKAKSKKKQKETSRVSKLKERLTRKK